MLIFPVLSRSVFCIKLWIHVWLGRIHAPLTLASGKVESLWGFTKLVEVSDSLVIKSDFLKVFQDSLRRDRFGDDGVAVKLGPGENDLCGSDSLALDLGETLCDGLDLWDVDEQREAEEIVSKCGIRCDDDALFLAVFDQRRVRDSRVSLNLVDGGNNARVLDDCLQLITETTVSAVEAIR